MTSFSPARILGAALLLAASSASAASDPGTCLTEAGLLMAPWTDGQDPACGEDCGEPEGDGLEAAACATADDGCVADAAPMRMPTPRGPVCLEPGPSCSPGSPAPVALGAGLALAAPIPLQTPRRAPGSLPGADPLHHVQTPTERAAEVIPPPPR